MQRKIIQEVADLKEEINRTFGSGDREKNAAAYESFRAGTQLLMDRGCRVEVEETWDRGLVCVSITIGRVEF